jgi:phosphoesterase RecJ-like protein
MASGPEEALSFLRGHRNFLLLGHKEPDGDCVASQIALSSLLSLMGKQTALFCVGPFDRPEIRDYEGAFRSSIPPEMLSDRPAVVVVDCSTPDRTGALAGQVKSLPILVIDHHASGEAFGDARFLDSSAPSSTILVLRLFDALGAVPDRDTARLLLFGLCTDTGFFRHVGPAGAGTFRDVARLVEAGTSTQEAYHLVYGGRALAARKLLARVLGRTESLRGGRILLTWEFLRDRTEILGVGGGAEGAWRGEDELYRLLQTVRGNTVVLFFREEGAGSWSVGLRSDATMDVSTVARSLGGGGHRQASGCELKGSLEEVRQRVLSALGSF